ncbi:MAG: NAD(P)-dependent oxidoreductase [Clostridiales bacterium]|nr:NAD(P)-dependent oxidoreductase [Clostridiales bacterium]
MWNEARLDEMLTTPSQRLLEDVAKIKGDIMILGAGGKMGPTLSLLAKKAVDQAGGNQKVIAVSRFTDPIAVKLLNDNGVDTIPGDLTDREFLNSLPEVDNIIYMVGRKFGTGGQEHLTWAMNVGLPVNVAERFNSSNIVVFSSGNVYPMVPIHSSGADEQVAPLPNGEYGMSSLGRERIFENASHRWNTPVFIYRLNFAIDLRYGVLYDIASTIMAGEPVSISMPVFNCIWQGDANEMAIRALLHTGSPATIMNITGPETVSTRYAAEELGRLLGKEVTFEGEESETAFLNNSALAMKTFGYPTVPIKTMLEWQAEWILSGGRALNKPTHFEERKGKY